MTTPTRHHDHPTNADQLNPCSTAMARPTPESRDRLFDKCFTDFDRVGDRFGETWDDLRDYALDRAQTDQNDAALKSMMPRVGMPPVSAADRDRIAAPVTLIHGRAGHFRPHPRPHT